MNASISEEANLLLSPLLSSAASLHFYLPPSVGWQQSSTYLLVPGSIRPGRTRAVFFGPSSGQLSGRQGVYQHVYVHTTV